MTAPQHYPDAVEELIGAFRQLPGIGRRGAERLVLAMLNWEPENLRLLGKLVAGLPESVGHCPECGMLANAGELCFICRQPARDATTVCVVENASQVIAIESSGNFRGRYHVLGGKLSPLDAENGSGLNLPALIDLANSGRVKEIILALSPDVEGRATAIYLAELLKDHTFFERCETGKWICTNCGHVHEGRQAPAVCPVCRHDRGYFLPYELACYVFGECDFSGSKKD